MDNIKIEDYDSRWEFMADRAGVPRKPDLDADPTHFNVVGRFVGDWDSEVDFLLKKYNNGRAFNFLSKMSVNTTTGMPDVPYTETLDRADMIRAGIDLDYKFVHKITAQALKENREQLPTLWKMIDWFGFTGYVIAKIHVQFPGQVFPYHFDDLTMHRNNSEQKHIMDTDPYRFARVEVQLRDWDYGHVWGIGNTYWSSWRAGEIMWHHWKDTPHGTANSGKVPRINLQITGEVTPELCQRLQSNVGDIIL